MSCANLQMVLGDFDEVDMDTSSRKNDWRVYLYMGENSHTAAIQLFTPELRGLAIKSDKFPADKKLWWMTRLSRGLFRGKF